MTNVFIECSKEYIKDTLRSLLGFFCFNKNETKAHIKHDKPVPPSHIVHIPKEALDLCNKMQAEGRPVTNNNNNKK